MALAASMEEDLGEGCFRAVWHGATHARVVWQLRAGVRSELKAEARLRPARRQRAGGLSEQGRSHGAQVVLVVRAVQDVEGIERGHPGRAALSGRTPGLELTAPPQADCHEAGSAAGVARHSGGAAVGQSAAVVVAASGDFERDVREQRERETRGDPAVEVGRAGEVELVQAAGVVPALFSAGIEAAGRKPVQASGVGQRLSERVLGLSGDSCPERAAERHLRGFALKP